MMLKDPNARSCQTARDLADSFEAACRDLGANTLRASNAPARISTNAYTPTVPETPVEVAKPGSTEQRTESGVTAGVQVGTPAAGSPPVADTLRSARSGRGRLFGTGLALLAAAGGIAITLKEGPNGAPASSAGQPSVPARPVEPAPVQSITVRLGASPPGAELTLDGQRLPGNPYVGARSADQYPHVLRAEAPGHEPMQQSLTLDRNVQLQLSLKPIPSAEQPAASTSAARVRPPAARATPLAAPALAEPASTTPMPTPTPTKAPEPAKSPFKIDRSDPWQQ
jgi:hypothetical protein